ncbi:alpha/beta hydrolase [Patescibacteria group bacterium]|nr:alpha/beta hydrolase [Patescibacteria group bacterium]
MRKRVFFIHGWGGGPEEGWRPWLKERLEAKVFTVINLSMPDTDYPRMNEWVETLSGAVGEPDKDCFFVGHSLGCITILRYLESLPKGKKVGGALLVAAFTQDLGINEIKNFFIKDINWEKIKKHCDNFTVLLSDNDHYVPITYGDIFKEKLNAKIIIEHDLGHFNGDDVTTELPPILDAFSQLAK